MAGLHITYMYAHEARVNEQASAKHHYPTSRTMLIEPCNSRLEGLRPTALLLQFYYKNSNDRK